MASEPTDEIFTSDYTIDDYIICLYSYVFALY